MNEKVKSIFGLIFVVWFLLSIIASIVLSKINELYSVIAFGQMFFVFGLIAAVSIFKKNKLSDIEPYNFLLLLFLFVGFFAIVIPILEINPNFFGFYINPDDIFPKIIFYVPLFVGGVLIMEYLYQRRQYNSDKYIKVSATVCELLKSNTSGDDLRSAIVSYNLNGKEYKYNTNNYISNNPLKEGDIVEIKVDPYDPENVFYYEKSVIVELLFGVLLCALSLIAIFMIN